MDQTRAGTRAIAPWRQAAIGPVLVLTTLISAIVSSLGAPLLLTVSRHFHTSVSSAQWSLTVALLAGAVSAPVFGRLGDGRRRRETLVIGLAIVTGGSVVAALAGSLGVLIAGRAMQGVGLGLVPLAMAAARDALPAPKVPGMIALLSVTAAAGIGAGYPISGLIADSWGLEGAYWFGTIVCGLALICVAVVVPSSAHRPKAAGLDILGAVLLAAALLATLVGIAEGSDWGWGSVSILGLLAAGVVLFAVWTFQQLRAKTPLVELRMLRHPAVLAADACAIVLGVAMYMNLSAVTEFVQLPRTDGFGFSASAVVAGFVLVPLSVFMLSGSRTLPTLVGRFGIRVVLTAGCFVVAFSSVLFAVFHSALWEAFVMMGVLGLGLGTTYAAIPGLIVQSVPAEETGSATGFYQVARYVGFSTGSALTAATVSGFAARNGAPTLQGYTTALWISVVICVLAAALAWFLPTRGAKVAAADRVSDEETLLLEETEGDSYVLETGR